MNEKMLQPEPEKVPETKMLPEDLQNKILDEQKVAHEDDVKMWAPPAEAQPKAAKQWAWGHKLSAWRKEELEKAMPEEEAEAFETVKSGEPMNVPVAETLRSADEEPASGIRETVRSDFSTKGTVKTSTEMHETEERPEGFVAKDVPNFETSALGKEPTKSAGGEQGTEDTLRAA